jgi:hypothetical protein
VNDDNPYETPNERDENDDGWFSRIPDGHFPKFAWWQWAVVVLFVTAIVLGPFLFLLFSPPTFGSSRQPATTTTENRLRGNPDGGGIASQGLVTETIGSGDRAVEQHATSSTRVALAVLTEWYGEAGG